MNKKGFAISGIIYSILILFLLLVFSILAILGSRKLIIDKFKSDVLDKIYGQVDNGESDGDGDPLPNPPELLNNMIPVYYNGENWIYVNEDDEWYDYKNKEWANAVVLNSGVTKNVGDIISENDVSLWYVWIPRYKYRLFNSEGANVVEQEIKILFEQGTATTGNVICHDSTPGASLKSEICINDENGNWYTHPAFTFGNQELTGFWVAKFEASGSTSKIFYKPNVSNLGSLSFATMFNAIKNISTIYGINGDNHMIKNMEWGAIAYLSNSKYGVCQDEECAIVTGNTSTAYYTGGGTSNAYKTNITQSTTGNIYGVYDMSAGGSEMIMGNMVTTSGLFYASQSDFSKAPESKYIDYYSYDTSGSTVSRGKLGDATKETTGWYGDSVGFVSTAKSGKWPNLARAWFYRGGYSTFVQSIFQAGSDRGYSNNRPYTSRGTLCSNE